jgi:hypothetical protein
MTEKTSYNPHKEEDEGYLAAAAGRSLAENLYPCGTIRHEDWRRGWHIKSSQRQRAINLGEGNGQEDEGYLAAGKGQNASSNPYPYGTIRFEDWRRGWTIRNDELQRARRLGDAISG